MAKLTETESCGTKCPLRRTLAVIEGKYTPFILKELFSGTKRFGQLRRSILGISPKTLSDKLKDLAEKGVVERISYPEVPPKVEYRLTFRGQQMKGIFQRLQEFWQEDHLAQSVNASAVSLVDEDFSAQSESVRVPAQPRAIKPDRCMHLLAQNQAGDN